MLRWWREITGYITRRRDALVVRRRLATYVGNRSIDV
jgi:hypothetical protein